MRQLTDSEQIARDVAKSSRNVPYLTDDLEHYIFDMGFVAALDHSAAYILSLEGQIAALTAALQQAQDTLRQAQDEQDGLREALQQIAAGNPAPPGGKWLSDAKMAQIAREALARWITQLN